MNNRKLSIEKLQARELFAADLWGAYGFFSDDPWAVTIDNNHFGGGDDLAVTVDHNHFGSGDDIAVTVDHNHFADPDPWAVDAAIVDPYPI